MTTSISGNTISSPDGTYHVAQGSSCSHQPLGWEDVTDHPWRVERPLSSIQCIGAWPLPDFPCRTQRPSNFQGLEVKLQSKYQSSGGLHSNGDALFLLKELRVWETHFRKTNFISSCLEQIWSLPFYLWGNGGLVRSDMFKTRNIWP